MNVKLGQNVVKKDTDVNDHDLILQRHLGFQNAATYS